MTGLVDTHCHLALLEEESDLSEVLSGARAAGVEQIVSVGLNLPDSRRNHAIAAAHRGVFFTVGWHPHESNPPTETELADLAELARNPRAVAIGEIGLDLYFRAGYHETPLATQVASIRSMYELARELRLPVLLHDRDAHDEILGVIRSFPDVRGVMHCFSGDAALARECIDAGYLISFSGIVTFPRTEALREAARLVDSEHLVVETDSPFLAPVPHRGRRNRPAYVADTARFLAELRGEEFQLLAENSTRAAQALFGLDPADTLQP